MLVAAYRVKTGHNTHGTATVDVKAVRRTAQRKVVHSYKRTHLMYATAGSA